MNPDLAIPVLVAVIAAGPAYITARKTRKAVGRPNGAGPVVEMLERTMHAVGRIESKVDSHAADQELHTQAVAIHRRGVERALWYNEGSATPGDEGDEHSHLR